MKFEFPIESSLNLLKQSSITFKKFSSLFLKKMKFIIKFYFINKI
uniref:Uncharacterized protein n=1 Tax=viral metagenome TaxID=1070528 RepID=A0A6C0ADU2_9ZZZZ